MKIAITQRQFVINDIIHDCLDPQWYSFLSPHEVIPVPNCDYIVPEFDVLIISGGEHSTARDTIEERYYRLALRKNIPVIGICHGAFLLNILNCGMNIVSKSSNHKGTNHTIEMDNLTYCVNSFHSLEIELNNLGENLIPIATHLNTVEAFEHTELPIYGIVWHPERMGKNSIIPKKIEELLYG